MWRVFSGLGPWPRRTGEYPGHPPPHLAPHAGQAGTTAGYLLEWIDPHDVTGNNVLILPGVPDAEPVPSRWASWQEGARSSDFAGHRRRANNEALVVLKTK